MWDSEQLMKRYLFLFAMVGGFLAARAAVRNFTFEGQVTYVTDFGFELDGSVTNGSPVKGFYIYDDSVADQNTDSTVGDYHYTNGVSGMTVRVGNYVFRTNPDHVDFLLEVVNRDRDSYLIRSYHNVTSTGLRIDEMAWQLDDASGTALTSDAIPRSAPNLLAYPDTMFGLSVDGGFDGYFIRAMISSVTVTTPVIPNPPEVTIKEAVEVTFPSMLGYFYQIEYSHDLLAWGKIGAPVLGDGSVISKFVPKVVGQTYYRANISTGP